MRIVYVSYLHPAIAPGGAQQVAHELYQASIGAGHEAYLIAALEQHHQEIYGKPGAPIVPMPGERDQYFYFPQFYDFQHLSVRDWRSTKFFRELIERLNPDVVHFHHYHRVGIESVRAARLAAPKAVISMTFHEMMAICMADGQMLTKPARDLCHRATPTSCNKCFPDLRPEFFSLRQARLQAILQDCDLFLFPSEFIAGRYVEWGVPASKCVVVPNGQADLGQNFDRKQHSAALNRFGFFGQFIDNKGVDVILEALLLLARENAIPPRGIVVEINGGNRQFATKGYAEKITQYIDQLKKVASPRIEIRDRGPYDRKQLAQRMSSVDWVLVPSTWWEVFGLVVSEAWMFGRPVLASSIAALKERITDGNGGLTFPIRDNEALARLMSSCVGNQSNWNALHATIAQGWSDIDMLEAHLNLWEEIRRSRAATPSSLPTKAAAVSALPDSSSEPTAKGPVTEKQKPKPRHRAKLVKNEEMV